MPIDFPNSPANGDTYTVGSKTWSYNDTSWVLLQSDALVGSGSISSDKLAADSVTEAKIASSAVTEAKLASSAVTAGKIASNAVTHDKLHSTLSAVTICTSSTKPASPFDGQVIYMTDVDQTAVWDGSAWVGLDPSRDRNVVINGAMSVWQRGTSFSNPAAYAYTADRWIIEHDGTGATRTISQQTFTPGAAPVSGYEGQYFLRYAVSVAGTGNTYQFVGQRIEDVRTLAGQTVTISFWAKADTTRTITVGCDQVFGSGGSSAAVGFSGTANVTTSWQKFTITGSLPSLSGKTIGTSSFVTLYFKAPALSTCTIDYWGVQLEAGAVATPFEFEDYGTTLAKCQRYYYRLSSVSSYQRFTPATGASQTNSMYTIMITPVTLRGLPSSIDYNLTGMYFNDGPNNIAVTGLSLDAVSGGNVVSILASQSGSLLTQFRPYIILGLASTVPYIGVSAEL